MANRSKNNSKATCFTVSDIQKQHFLSQQDTNFHSGVLSVGLHGFRFMLDTGPVTRPFILVLYIYGLWIEGYYRNKKLYFIIAPPCLCPLSEIGSPEYIPSLFISLWSGREGDFDRLTVSAHAITTLHLYLRRVH